MASGRVLPSVVRSCPHDVSLSRPGRAAVSWKRGAGASLNESLARLPAKLKTRLYVLFPKTAVFGQAPLSIDVYWCLFVFIDICASIQTSCPPKNKIPVTSR